jgi:hypothetical protein
VHCEARSPHLLCLDANNLAAHGDHHEIILAHPGTATAVPHGEFQYFIINQMETRTYIERAVKLAMSVPRTLIHPDPPKSK